MKTSWHSTLQNKKHSPYFETSVSCQKSVFPVNLLTLFKGLELSSGITALIVTTEPALYGVLGILRKPFIGTVAGGAVGGAIMAIFKVYGSGLGPVPLAGIGMFLGDKFLWYLAGVSISVGVSMAVTHFVGFEDVKDNQ